MKILSLFRKNGKQCQSPLWSIHLFGESICYHGEEISDFLKKFDHIEDHIISLWDVNQVSWGDYQKMVAEVQEARQLFVRFAYN